MEMPLQPLAALPALLGLPDLRFLTPPNAFQANQRPPHWLRTDRHERVTARTRIRLTSSPFDTSSSPLAVTSFHSCRDPHYRHRISQRQLSLLNALLLRIELN